MDGSWRHEQVIMRIGRNAAATVALMAPMPIANHVLGAERSGVELSLVFLDLGGITEHSGRNAFPPLPVTYPVAANHRCYSP
jgi:hypothetical protein